MRRNRKTAPRNDSNAGSRARDHLANERTFLAWVRTALGGLALGIALERFDGDESGDANLALSVSIIGASLAVLAAATIRYYKVANDLDDDRFTVERHSPAVILVGAVVLAVVVIVLAL